LLRRASLPDDGALAHSHGRQYSMGRTLRR